MSTKNPVAIQRRSLDAFFSATVSSYPDRPALHVSGRSLSYRELNTESEWAERTLSAANRGGRRCNIGLVYAKSALSYAAILAIMRSDNVYIPLNPKLPADRLLRIIEDADIKTLIVDTSDVLSDGVSGALRQARPLQIIVGTGNSSSSFDSALRAAPQHRVWPIAKVDGVTDAPPAGYSDASAADATALSYIIYTSGSTGLPKGVAITRESACRCIEKLHEMFATHAEDRFTQFSALSFDVSVADLFLCWKSGGTLYVPAHSDELVPLRFAASHGITVWSSVPSIANFLLKLGLLSRNALPSIRLSFFAGEALPTELAHAWSVAAPNSRIFNIYGPTECTIFSTCYEHRSQSHASNGVVPIGLPLPGLRYLIVDDGRVVDGDDIPGELWLSGDQVAKGYWNNPTATQKAFVRFPSDEPAADIWYRTGDLVSRQRDSGLSFRGRLDRQVKLRGYRVELQEVESVLRDISGCTLAAVVPVRNTGGICEKIVAYCDSLNADEVTVKARCLTRLPQYMVPERIFRLDSLPLSDHGKVDYLALAARAENWPT
jgi:amino acid adenylation domain-containing protein